MDSRTIYEALKRLSSAICLSIRGGPLKGEKWILSTGRRFLDGTYEKQKTDAIVGSIRTGDVVFDIGAHVGYFSLIMAKTAGHTGKVFSFEPRPLNLAFLRKHIRVNNYTNVTTFPYCIGDSHKSANFDTHTGTGTGHLSEKGNLRVEMISVDGAIKEGLLPAPTFMKIDVEGAEILVLKGAIETIKSGLPRIMLAVHSDDLEKQCRDILEPLGYVFTDVCQEKGDKEFIVQIS